MRAEGGIGRGLNSTSTWAVQPIGLVDEWEADTQATCWVLC